MSSHTSISSKSGFRIYAQLCPRTPAKKSDPFSAKVKLSHSKNMSDFEYTCSGIGLPISQGNGLERVGPRSPPSPAVVEWPSPCVYWPSPFGRFALLVAPYPLVVDVFSWSPPPPTHPLSSICPWFPPPPCGRLKFYM